MKSNNYQITLNRKKINFKQFHLQINNQKNIIKIKLIH